MLTRGLRGCYKMAVKLAVKSAKLRPFGGGGAGVASCSSSEASRLHALSGAAGRWRSALLRARGCVSCGRRAVRQRNA